MLEVLINGGNYKYEEGTLYSKIASDFQKDFEDDIVLVQVNGELRELTKKLEEDAEVSFVTTKEKIGRKTYRRSVVLLMQRALNGIEPGLDAKLHVQYSLGQGYYCEMDGMEPDKEWVLKLKIAMMALVDEELPFGKKSYHTAEARRIFSEYGLKDKEKLLRYRRSSNINIYDLDGTMDYHFGYMVPHTGYLKYFDLMVYGKGFMLLFPNENTKMVAPFEDRPKLYDTLQASSDWGISMGIHTVGDLNEAVVQGKTRDIILMQEALMEERIGAIAAEIVSDSRRKFVMIAGPSSSGKTTFSHRLSNQLRARGVVPHPIPLDDYYKNRVDCPKNEDGSYDFECLEALDVELFNQNMSDLLAGKEVELPNYNFRTGSREYKGHTLKLGDNDVLVIEGIHGLNEKMSYRLPKENKFKIYISALTQLSIDEHNPLPTTDGRIIRRIVRDSRTRGTSAKETIAMWASVRRGEENYIFPNQEQADVMFNSALIFEMAVLKLYAEPQLFAIEKGCPEYKEAKRLLKLLDYFLPIPPEDIQNISIVREFIGGSIFPV